MFVKFISPDSGLSEIPDCSIFEAREGKVVEVKLCSELPKCESDGFGEDTV